MSDPESYAISAEMQLPPTERVTARALTKICTRRTEMAVSVAEMVLAELSGGAGLWLE